MEKTIETQELKEAEVFLPQPVIHNARIDALLELAENTERIGQAMDKVRRFILSRALPGDWVKFGEKDKSGYLELTSAGADRIAAVVGISFKNFKFWKETFEEEHKGQFLKGYIWWYSADILFQNRIIEGVQGRASTKDKFFGFEYGNWKELADIREDNIQVAARRNCMKEGVKLMLGIRRLPEESCEVLGLNPKVLRGYVFGQGAVNPVVDQGTEVLIKEVKEITGKSGKKSWTRYQIVTSDGEIYNTFDKELAKGAIAVCTAKDLVKIWSDKTRFGKDLKRIEIKKEEPKPEEINQGEINGPTDAETNQ